MTAHVVALHVDHQEILSFPIFGVLPAGSTGSVKISVFNLPGSRPSHVMLVGRFLTCRKEQIWSLKVRNAEKTSTLSLTLDFQFSKTKVNPKQKNPNPFHSVPAGRRQLTWKILNGIRVVSPKVLPRVSASMRSGRGYTGYPKECGWVGHLLALCVHHPALMEAMASSK